MSGLLRVAAVAASLVLMPMAAQAGDASESHDWSGAYAGAHAGFLWGTVGYVEPDDPRFGFDADIDGLAGGLLAGYNHRIDQFVLGVEVDAGLADARFGSRDSGGNGYSAFELAGSARLRARLGLALEGTLLYLAGGLAAARLTVDDTDPGFGKDRATHLGWTLGGGVEHAVTDRLTLRVEYLYDDYGSKTHTIASPAGSPFFPSYEAKADLTSHTVRMAVAYRF